MLADRVTASTAQLCVSLASALYCSKPGSFSLRMVPWGSGLWSTVT